MRHAIFDIMTHHQSRITINKRRGISKSPWLFSGAEITGSLTKVEFSIKDGWWFWLHMHMHIHIHNIRDPDVEAYVDPETTNAQTFAKANTVKTGILYEYCILLGICSSPCVRSVFNRDSICFAMSLYSVVWCDFSVVMSLMCGPNKPHM